MSGTSRATIVFDDVTRDMLRALCHEYNSSLAQVVRQLVRAQYHAVFPGQTPTSVPLRPQDNAAQLQKRAHPEQPADAIPQAF